MTASGAHRRMMLATSARMPNRAGPNSSCSSCATSRRSASWTEISLSISRLLSAESLCSVWLRLWQRRPMRRNSTRRTGAKLERKRPCSKLSKLSAKARSGRSDKAVAMEISSTMTADIRTISNASQRRSVQISPISS